MGFDAFVERYHEHMTRDPNACVNLGVERNLGALTVIFVVGLFGGFLAIKLLL